MLAATPAIATVPPAAPTAMAGRAPAPVFRLALAAASLLRVSAAESDKSGAIAAAGDIMPTRPATRPDAALPPAMPAPWIAPRALPRPPGRRPRRRNRHEADNG